MSLQRRQHLVVLCYLCRTIPHLRPLSRDPFTNVGRAVFQFDSLSFAQRQEFHSFAVYEKDVLEIDGHSAPFLFQQAPKHIHILPCNPSADAQEHAFLSDKKAVDSPGHCRLMFELLYLLLFPSRLAKTRFCRPRVPTTASPSSLLLFSCPKINHLPPLLPSTPLSPPSPLSLPTTTPLP